ncbi:hypothetical protein, partial [Marivirga sp.]|uniref:hypothetical protein n=1 Tax=Marivirga sp. TaxID=2018662 RepID=UPI0025FB264F
ILALCLGDMPPSTILITASNLSSYEYFDIKMHLQMLVFLSNIRGALHLRSAFKLRYLLAIIPF